MASRKVGKGGRVRPVGFAVVGLGHIAQHAVLPAFANAKPHARLVALVSGDAEKRKRLASAYRVPHAYDYAELDECLANPDVEAIYIATPNTEHKDIAIRAARAGVHVLCEKPMATSEAECLQMIRACADSGVRLMVAYRLHYEPANLRAIEIAQSGQIGEPKLFTSEFGYQVEPENIRTKPELGGGAIWDIGLYCVNAARYLFGAEPSEAFAYATHSDDPRFRGLHESFAAVLRFPGERLASFSCSFGTAAVDTFRIVGTEGDLRVENAYEYEGPRFHKLTVGEKSSTRRFPPVDQFAPELIDFAQAIREGYDPEPSGWEGLADVRVIRALLESARERRPVWLPEVERYQRPRPEQAMELPATEEATELVHAEAPTQ